MKIVRNENRICPSCMEQHEIDVVEDLESVEYKNVMVTFFATYWYCSNTDEYFADEDMMRANKLAVINTYRKMIGTHD